MPAPVDFNVSAAPLPPSFNGTPQQFMDAMVSRLTVTPNEPWASFQNTNSIPSSDVGPVLYEGREWRVWDPVAGAYTYHRQNGQGLVAGSTPISALEDRTPKSVVIYDANGKPAVLAPPSTDTMVLGYSQANGPYWRSPVGGSAFEALVVGGDQPLPTDDTATKVLFNYTRFALGDASYDGANCRVNVPANSLWFFYCHLQIEDTAAASTEVQVNLQFLPSNVPSFVIGSNTNAKTMDTRMGVFASGVMFFPVADTVSIFASATEATPSGTGLAIKENGANTRFGGFRLA